MLLHKPNISVMRAVDRVLGSQSNRGRTNHWPNSIRPGRSALPRVADISEAIILITAVLANPSLILTVFVGKSLASASTATTRKTALAGVPRDL